MIKTPIDLDSQDTWPKDVLDILNQNRDLVLNYRLEELRIDKIAEEDVTARIHRPSNRFAEQYNNVLLNMRVMIEGYPLVVYHCTKLTNNERVRIIETGLHILTHDLVHKRLDNAVTEGLLTATQSQTIRTSENFHLKFTNWGNRPNKIWFCSSQSILSEWYGIGEFFRYWGGEVLYFGRSIDDNILPILDKIGSPAIIRCFLPVHDIHINIDDLEKRLISSYLRTEIEYPEPPFKFDCWIERDLAPSEIIDIIEFNSPLFQELTDYASWPENKAWET